MGVDEDGKYIVHIREVVTIFHGTSRAITMDTTPNVASRFMKWGTIGEVYAWDGRSSYITSGELAFVLPATV